MSAELLSTLSIVSFIVAGVSLVASVIIWILFKIPKVISDLSGRTARRSIATIRASNERSGNKSYRPSETNAERGKITGTMPQSEEMDSTALLEDEMPETGLLSENKAIALEDETGLLEDSETGLLDDCDETSLLDEGQNNRSKRKSSIVLSTIEEVMLIHTDEVIE